MRLALATVGLTSTVAQVLLMREMVATFYGNELLFGLVLMAWLAWVAVGSWGLPRLVGFPGSGEAAFAGGLAIAAGVLPAQMALVRGTRSLLEVTPGAFVPWASTAMAAVLIPAPLCVLGGLLFALGARLTVKQGGTTGQAYVWESVGALIGGVLFSFVLIRWLDPFQVALLVASVAFIVALLIPLQGSRFGPRRVIALLFGLLALLVAGSFALGRQLHRTTLRWPWLDLGPSAPAGPGAEGSAYRLVFAADSPYGRLVVWARDGQLVFYENGLLAFETQGTFPEEVAHLPLLMDPNPGDVLLIGGGVAGDVREILKHPVDSVTYVELDPLLIEAARTHLPPDSAAMLSDPRVTVALTDGRLFVRQTARRFDTVIIDLPAPSTGALNRFYTREFFAEVRAALKPGGVLSLGLSSAENYWSPELVRRNASVYKTLLTVFPQVMVLPGEHNFFLASEAPLTTEPTALAQRLSDRDIEGRRVTPEYVAYLFGTDRFEGVRQELNSATEVRINQDFTPICYYYSLILWLSRFSPRAWGAIEAAAPLGLRSAVVLLVLIVLLTRWQRRWAVPFAVAGIGLAEMMLEVVILFAFQVLRGTVYAEISLIVTAFMAGLVLGGQVSNRMVARTARHEETGGRRRPGVETTWHSVGPLLSDRIWARRALISVQAAIGIYGGLFPLLLWVDIPAPRVVFPLLALLAGALAGMTFPLATAVVRGRPERVAGMLYGADLIGGCLGALLSAVFLVPLLGIPNPCGVITLVGLAGILALV